MRGWNRLKEWFKKLWKAEKAAQENASETSNDSQLSRDRRNTAADWAERQRQAADAARRQKELDEARKRLEEQIELEELERAERARKTRGASTAIEPGGSLAPLPSAQNYAGDVPSRRQWREESALWIVTGKFHTVQNSENVYAIAYNIQRGSLFVQYKHWAPPMEIGAQHGPGPIYEYKNVSIAEAHALYRAKDVGSWLWDNVRVRGTWSDHRKPYRLVAMSNNYLPRKATWWSDGREWFIRRQAWNASGQAAYSQLPNAPAPPMGMDGKPILSQWRPDRGRPNRGRPNRGRGDSPGLPY